MDATLPSIAVTMGDPAGVGPEICLDLLADSAIAARCRPVVVGDFSVLRRVAEQLGKPLPERVVSQEAWSDAHRALAGPAVLDVGAVGEQFFDVGRVSPVTGEASYRYVTTAIDEALAGHFQAVTTAPINKEALRTAGVHFPGHTEIFAERMGAERSCMMLTSAELTCSFVTVHVGYHEVPELLSEERVYEVIELTVEAMRRIRGREPKLVVCGLNPHAGEHGLFGQREEERFILPAIERARQRNGWDIEGPLPPDTAFLEWRRRETDAFVCMYHDQGHIPLKALAFDKAINTTLGLPIVRTSVDHGTAFDIAWQGKANPGSLFEAVQLAARLASAGSPSGGSAAIAGADPVAATGDVTSAS